MILSDINQIIRENMDLNDPETVSRMNVMMEANQNLFLVALTSKLYDKIQEKATRIDFSTIEQSRGDITKIQNFKSMVECVSIIQKIVREYKESTIAIDNIANAIDNVNMRSRMFKKAFAIGSSLPMLTYNSICLAIVESISFMISVCIEYIKTPGNDTFQMALDTVAYNKAMQNLLFTNLVKFNQSCKTRELDNAMELVMSQAVANREAADIIYQKAEVPIAKDHPFLSDDEINGDQTVVIHDEDEVQNTEEVQQEAGLRAALSYAGNKVLLWICKLFIPFIRQIVYFFYYHKQKMSDYWEDQANLIQMNAMDMMANNDRIPEDKKKEIYAKQMKIVEKYRKRANELSIDYTISKKNSEKLESDESKKFKSNEIDDDYEKEDDYNYASIFEAELTVDCGVKIESLFTPATVEERLQESIEKGQDKFEISGNSLFC